MVKMGCNMKKRGSCFLGAAALMGVLSLGISSAYAKEHNEGTTTALHVCGSSIASNNGNGDFTDSTGSYIMSKPRAGFFLPANLPKWLALRSELNFTQILVDTHDGYDAAANSYTIPSDGIYRVTLRTELFHDPEQAVCVHVWLSSPSRGIAVQTLISDNSVMQLPSQDPYQTVTNGNQTAFKGNIDTDFYFKAGDILYPMVIQFLNPKYPTKTAPAKLNATEGGIGICENHMFKVYKVSPSGD